MLTASQRRVLREMEEALSHEERRRILTALLDTEALTVGELEATLDMPATTVKRHLSHLNKAGLLKAHDDDEAVSYAVTGVLTRANLQALANKNAGT